MQTTSRTRTNNLYGIDTYLNMKITYKRGSAWKLMPWFVQKMALTLTWLLQSHSSTTANSIRMHQNIHKPHTRCQVCHNSTNIFYWL